MAISKQKSHQDEYIWSLRHSAEHVLHTAMQILYPNLKKVMGPAIDSGFYFDFDTEEKISEENFPQIEALMQKIINSNLEFKKVSTTPEQAKELFKDNPYKLNNIAEIQERGEEITLYQLGEEGKEFYDMDLCAGPHVANTSEIKAFKLLSIAGAYYKGDSKNKMLDRIYGTAFGSQEELTEHLVKLEDAKNRDHKKLGKELDLFYVDEKVGKGLPMWTPKGTAVKFQLEDFTRQLERRYNYEHVCTPYLGKEDLYKTSGHLDHYSSNMYAPIDMDGELFYLRPMACPHHIRMFQRKQWSYRDLPVRYAEIADYNRFEKSGELMGMLRVRKFQLTDAHIFVEPDGIKDEFKSVCQMIQEGISGLGLKDSVTYRFSKRDKNDTEKYYPDNNLWEKSEGLMKEALDELGLNYYEAEGEAAFYGPKLDIQMTNINGKEDTAFTAQIDFLLPEKFEIEYIDREGYKQRPVMIHRSAIGSLERVFAYLIEHYAGAFPVWLAPVQVEIIPISEKHNDYAYEIAKQLKDKGLRVNVNSKNDNMRSKIRTAQEEKVPYMFILGDNEVLNKQVSIRFRNNENLNGVEFQVALDKILEKNLTKSQDLW